MPSTPKDTRPSPKADAGLDPRYPNDHVIAIVETADQAAAAVATLTRSGFLPSEVTVISGRASADALKASTGRTGLTHLAIRIAEQFGVEDDEMELKRRFETALRDGHYVVMALALTDERKHLAARLFKQHGARQMHFMGKLAIEPLDG